MSRLERGRVRGVGRAGSAVLRASFVARLTISLLGTAALEHADAVGRGGLGRGDRCDTSKGESEAEGQQSEASHAGAGA